MGRGDRPQNQLGQLCAICGIFFPRLLKKWPRIDALDVLLFLLTSSAPWLGEPDSCGRIRPRSHDHFYPILFEGRYAEGPADSIILSVVLLVLSQAVLISIANTSIADLFFSSTGRDSSLTGRVPLWQELIRIGSQRPLLGSGYGSFWSGKEVPGIWEKIRWTPVSGHNGYIDIFMNLGSVGLAILLFFLVSTYRNISQTAQADRYHGSLRFVFFIIIVLQNVTESTLSVANSFLWILLLFSSVNVTRKPSQGEIETGGDVWLKGKLVP